MFDRDWNGVPTNSVALASRRAIEAALKPRYGGIIVDELVTLPCKNEHQQTYAWRRGDVIELCGDGAYLSRIGDIANVVLIDVAMIARAGDEWPDTMALETQTTADLRVRNEMSVRNETALMNVEELDQAFSVASSGMLLTAPGTLWLSAQVDGDFDAHFATVTL